MIRGFGETQCLSFLECQLDFMKANFLFKFGSFPLSIS